MSAQTTKIDRRRGPARGDEAAGQTQPAEPIMRREGAGAEVDAVLAVPAYVHPSVDPRVWQRLADLAAVLRYVVVNVDSGPGERVDPAYPAVIQRLRDARAPMVGYVDTDYGRRPVADVVADARLWVTRYGMRGVFLDQVAGDFAHLEYYAACALGARAAGAQFVVANPGTNCHPAYAEIANVTVTFEGTWQDYQRYRPSEQILAQPATRFCHLVYDVPTELLSSTGSLAAQRHASSAMFTDGSGTNPWDRLPQQFVDACAAGAVATVRAPAPAPARAPARGPTGRGWGQRRYAGG